MNKNSKILGSESIWKLLIKLSLPATIGMMVQALYNLVDTIFVGRGVGTLGITGITLSFPVQMIVMAIAQMIGIGGASIISRALGEKNAQKAEKTMGNIFTLVILMSATISILGLIFINPLLSLLGTNSVSINAAKDYLSIILFGTIFFSFSMASNNIVRAEGNAKTAMYTMLISAGLNIILDPIFIFILHLGIKGAAIATVLSQATTALYLIYYFLSGKSSIKLHFKNFKLKSGIITEIMAIGSSAFVRQSAGSLLTIILNNILMVYGGVLYVAVYGLTNRLLMFVLMPLFGIAQGFQPIAGFNYGAKNYSRVKDVTKASIITTTILSSIGFFILILFPKQLLSVFTTDTNLILTASNVLKIIILFLPLIGIQIIGATMFQAIGKAFSSLILAMSRQIIFLIPLIYIMPIFFGINGVWISFPISDFLATLLTSILFYFQMKKFNTNSTLSKDINL
ncbi:MATE family efflux transporter [Tepiditoga spiralis]|uniref:Multidrug export protein MepA n=1 Tax=Tepiditoga spiralis TaxID=2108365 RepID=A0A7G1GAW7_9BACT|nr:MATE family efflux transporter [Tepiditoga spiralis]BBE30709.1 MATE family efflux transporter [Tepiditoga spiralis]